MSMYYKVDFRNNKDLNGQVTIIDEDFLPWHIDNHTLKCDEVIVSLNGSDRKYLRRKSEFGTFEYFELFPTQKPLNDEIAKEVKDVEPKAQGILALTEQIEGKHKTLEILHDCLKQELAEKQRIKYLLYEIDAMNECIAEYEHEIKQENHEIELLLKRIKL